MNTDLVFSKIENLFPLAMEEKAYLASLFRERRVKRKQLLLMEGAVQRASYFVSKGLLASTYIDLEGKEHIIQFAPEGWWISDLNSFTKQQPGRLNIRALDDSVLIELPFENTPEMFENVPLMERYFRVITERAFISFQQRVIENNSMEAGERWKLFNDRHSDLVMRLPQKMIASFLGITPEFLSRIRRNTASPMAK